MMWQPPDPNTVGQYRDRLLSFDELVQMMNDECDWKPMAPLYAFMGFVLGVLIMLIQQRWADAATLFLVAWFGCSIWYTVQMRRHRKLHKTQAVFMFMMAEQEGRLRIRHDQDR